MKLSLQRLITWIIVIALICVCAPAFAGSLSSEPSADDRIFIFDQSSSGAHCQGNSIGILHKRYPDGTTMATAGCSLYATMHAYQWVTGDKRTTSNASDLINEFLTCNGTTSLQVQDHMNNNSYTNHLKNNHNVKVETPTMTESSLAAFFGKGGALKVYTPNGTHFVTAIGSVVADIDGNGSSETWIHVVDSAAYFSFNTAYENITGCRTYTSHTVLNKSFLDTRNNAGRTRTNNRKEDNYAALEYWVPYSSFSKYGIVVGYLPGETSGGSSGSWNVVSYENCIYKIIKDTTLRKEPFDSAAKGSTMYANSDTVTSVALIDNGTNYWLKLTNGEYIFAGYTNKGVQTGNQYLEFVKDNSACTSSSGWNLPSGNLTPGKGFELKGDFSYSSSIASVEAEVYKANSSTLVKESIGTTANKKTCSYSIYTSTVNTGLPFSQLSNGDYRIDIKVNYYYNRGKTTSKVINSSTFSVGSSGSTASTLQFSNVTYPKTFRINTANGWALGSGTLASNYELRTITSKIVNSSGTALSSATKTISGYSYSIISLDTYSSTDNGVKFSKITSAGSYKWILTATDSAGRTLTLEMPFTAVSSGSTSTSTASRTYTDKVSVTGVSVDLDEVTLREGQQTYITATVSPSNASDKAITWSSSNTAVATVASATATSATITAKKGGSTTITCTTSDGNYKATCKITVTTSVTGISLSPTTLTLEQGKTSSLTATIAPSGATNKNVHWYTSNSSVATVTNGVVKGVGAGTATITAMSEDGGYTANCTVTVFIPEVYLDLNGWLNDQPISSLNGYGTADIYINGNLAADDVQDYREKWPVGTTYEIKDIRATQAFAYNGVYSGSLSGKLGTSDAIVVLSFERPAKPVVSVTPGTKYTETIFSWPAVSRTTHYDVRVFNSNMDDVFESYRRQTCDKTQFSALLSPGTYYVSVSASNTEKSTWNISNKVQFTVADANNPTPGILASKAEGNHKLYAVYSKDCTWLEAESLAEQSAGSFVSITSQAEQDVITKLCAQVDFYCWIGAERFRNNKWAWGSGESFNYTNWCDDEPSDTGVWENVLGTYSADGKWNDYSNSSATPGGYILEYEPIALNVTTKEDSYEEHKVFSKNDLEVKVTFADGTTLITDDYTLDSQDCVNGNHIVMVYYGGIELCAHVTVPSTPTYATGTCGNNLTWEYSNNVLMIEGSGPMSTYDYNTNNPPPWSAYREVVKQVVIEKGVTSIGSDVFMDMINLTQVSIPNTVTDIRNYTFYGCTSLKNIVIPASVKKIGNNLFNGCSSLTSISLPEGLESIGEYAFNMCTALESVNVPEGITILNKCTFQGCENLSVVKLPNSLTTIGWSAFNSCIGLNSITIPDNVTTIEQFAFSQCKNLATIQMPMNLENVGFRAFYNCEALTRLILPECLETIGERAFDECSNLANIYVYADETSIHDLAFYGLNDFIVHCYEDSSMHRYADSHELEYVLIPRHNEAIKVELPSSLIVIEEQAFANNTFECVVIPDGCTTIKAGAFEGNTALRFVEIPASVKQIDATAFKNCNSALVFITEAGSAAESYANSHSIYCVFK